MSFGDHVETRSELEAAELDRENRVADRLATNAPEMDWIVATEIQRRAEDGEGAGYPRGTAPAMAHLIERDRHREQMVLLSRGEAVELASMLESMRHDGYSAHHAKSITIRNRLCSLVGDELPDRLRGFAPRSQP